MPVEPDPTPWVFPEPDQLDPSDDLVATGADLAPGTLLAAYRRGLFPMPAPPPQSLWWFYPQRRGILPLDALVVSRSLRRSARRFDVRVDTAFEQVVRACGDPRRPQGWIDEDIVSAYTELHRLGWAHSVETWLEGRLVGGLYAVATGGLVAGESMFHHETDASKVALLALVDLMRDEYADRRLLDVQWSTPHLASLGVVEVPRSEYLTRLSRALSLPLPQSWRAVQG